MLQRPHSQKRELANTDYYLNVPVPKIAFLLPVLFYIHLNDDK